MRKDFFQDGSFGWNGLTTFILSNILLVFAGGITLLWLYLKIVQLAKTAATEAKNAGMVLVPGLILDNNTITPGFRARLNRAASLYHAAEVKPTIILMGGILAPNTLSEAAAGAAYLAKREVDETAIVLEESSRHTLENMHHARSIIGSRQAVIITSRFHLLRSVTLARGLGMQVSPLAAEDRFNFNSKTAKLMLKEAYYLHWYWSGCLWRKVTSVF